MDDKPPPYTAQPAVYPTAPVGSAYPPGHAPYPPPGGAPYPVQAGGPPPAVGFVVPTPAYTTVTVPQERCGIGGQSHLRRLNLLLPESYAFRGRGWTHFCN
ncbi:hypothetical protein CRM22_005862 [Opisthorchis felineus]|uniref:Uncharacterized protein n=1 Tax=Opisthorchis felineus TaxID=147828 RepID=A0A4S2LWC8_OPIFE|nr:hypothetical protein CRM22_005862 [Opisthorchis felineus]